METHAVAVTEVTAQTGGMWYAAADTKNAPFNTSLHPDYWNQFAFIENTIHFNVFPQSYLNFPAVING
jgi:hypothetical protein